MPVRMILSFAAVMLVASTAAADATLVAVTGKVTITGPDGKGRSGKAGQMIAPGSRIKTASKATAEVRFKDGSLLKVRSGSSLAISGNKRAKKKKNSVLLFFGRVWSKVTGSGSKDSTYEVSTPNAVCGVRGTEFETAVADDGSVRVRVAEGTVAVGEDGKEEGVGAGEEVEADEDGVDEAGDAEERAKWEMWEKRKRERLKKGGKGILDKMKGKIMSRKQKVETLRAQQKAIEDKRASAEKRARGGDMSAIKEIRKYNAQLAEIADAIADIGDQAESQFQIVDHFADLAQDPRFGMVNRKYIEAEAASLRRVKKMLDAMVKDGTDISMEAMDDMLDDMSKGKGGGLKDDRGSSVKDLFGGDDMMK